MLHVVGSNKPYLKVLLSDICALSGFRLIMGKAELGMDREALQLQDDKIKTKTVSVRKPTKGAADAAIVE